MSSCLLGQAVRYDGAHKRDVWVTDRIGPLVEWTSVCPEAEAGLGVPRERIQMELAAGGIEVRGLDSRTDYTSTLHRWSQRRLDELELDTLDGYVCKARSPSCGTQDVAVFEGEHEVRRAPGRFVAALLERDPLLPLCTEDELQAPASRRHFLERAQTRARWRALVATLPRDAEARTAAVAAFLARHQLLLRCREQEIPPTGDCGCDVAALTALGRELAVRMSRTPTLAGQVEALAAIHDALDALGTLSADERVGLALLVRDVASGDLDVEVARQLARGLILRASATSLAMQHYLDPVPVPGNGATVCSP